MKALDQYFKENLGDHSLPPPGSAWERVREESASPSHGNVWAAAAALLLLGLVGYYLIVDGGSDPVTLRQAAEAQSTPVTPELEPATPKANVPSVSLPDTGIKHASGNQKKSAHREATVATVAASEDVMAQEAVHVVIADTELPVSPPATENPEKGIVIHFTLGPVEDAEPVVASAGEPVVQAVGVGKVLEAAREFRETDPYGRLRQAKDEIFALNFLSKKSQSTENEKHQ
jgi:hypothetical protein